MRVSIVGCRKRGAVGLACLLLGVAFLLSAAAADAADAEAMKFIQAIKDTADRVVAGAPRIWPDQREISGSMEYVLLAADPASASTVIPAKANPAEYEKLVAESPYPKTDAPQNLSLEQLEAIAKLPPMSSKIGLQTHPAMLPLFRDMILHYNGGSYKGAAIHFRLHTPEKFEKGKKYPLVVWLHGAGECGPDNIDQLSHLHHIIPSLVGPKKRDFFLLVPQCPHSHRSWEAPEICSTTVRPDGTVECHQTDDAVALGNAPNSFTIAMIEAVTKDYPVDANRITVAGLSTGGRGVWKILEQRPDLFAAAVPIVSWQAISDKALREKPLLKKIPIWAIYSSDDNGIDTSRKEFERLKNSGCRVSKTEFGVCGHRAWTPAMLQGDIFGWLIARAKDGERYYAAEPSSTGPEKVGIFADVTEGDLKKKPTRAPAKTKEADKPQVQPSPPAVRKPAAKAAVNKLSWRFTPPNSMPHVTVYPPQAVPYVATPCSMPIDQVRVELVLRYIEAGELEKALAVADKMKSNHLELCKALLNVRDKKVRFQLLDYIDAKLDRLEKRGMMIQPPHGVPPLPPGAPVPYRPALPAPPKKAPSADANKASLTPIPAGKKSPMDECGKEWSMSTTTQYGLFPSGWDKEASHVPAYVLNESGQQLYERLAKAFHKSDLAAMKELCDSFIELDDIPLSSPWFDTSGGRLKGRIKYTLNEKAKPVVRLLADIARVKAESKKEFTELAQKALERIAKITNPKVEDKK